MAEPNGYIQGKDGKPLELVDATARRQLAGKLDAPGGVKAGDYLRVKSVGADGTVVVEGTEGPEPDSGHNVTYGSGLKYEDGVLSVETTDQVEQDNTLPITSAGVHTVVGNIDALLATI